MKQACSYYDVRLVLTFKAFDRRCIAFLLMCWVAQLSFAAGPSGGAVSAGSATITQSAAQTTIKQTTDKAVINWGNFSIGGGSLVRFVQPSASSIALNRVTGSQASVIQGALQANGQVWVLNPNGVLIAPGGQVVAGSFLATTRALTDQQFMAGHYAFTDGGVAGASVVNQGSIVVAEGGYAVLAGEAVRNEGYIEANLGQVVLGGAKAFTLDITGDNTLAFVVTTPVDVTPADGKAIVDNTGSIQAAGGRVLMTARAASQVVGQVINTDGVVAATSAQMVNGKIVLDGGAGSISVAGNLNVSGKSGGQTGGAIDVNAQKIQVKSTAKLDVTGDAGGGKIAIGGGGANTRTQSFTPAESTTIAAGARLDASALTRGDGGEILVLTNLTNPLAFTQVAGSLIARGGTQGGNGGFVETSGYRLDVNGIVVATNAPKGRIGLWLLDPDTIFISTAGPTGVIGTDSCSNSVGGLTNCSTIKVSDLVGRLNGGEETGASDVALSATSGITVDGGISWSSSKRLTLSATGPTGYINVNKSISNTSDEGGELVLNANAINVYAGVSMASGDVTATGTGVASRFSLTALAGTLTANNIRISAATVEINKAVTATGIFSIAEASTVTIASAITANSISVTSTTGDGTIAIQANLSQGGGGTTLSAKEVTFSGGPLTTNGLLTVEATTAITLDTVLNVDRVTLTAPRINVNATQTSGFFTFAASTVNWADGISFLGGDGSGFTVSAPAEHGPTTFALASDLSIRAYEIRINNNLNWSTQRLTLNSDRAGEGAGQGVYIAGGTTLTGTGGARLSIPVDASFQPAAPTTVTLSGTEANAASFTLGTGAGATIQTADTVRYKAAAATVTVTNTASGGGGGGGGGSSSSDGTVVVTPAATTTTSTAAASAAAKAAADAAAAKAVAAAAAAKAAELDTTTKVVVDQAATQAVATVVASTSAAVFVAPAPPPPAATTTSSANSTASTSSASSSNSTSTTTTASTTTVTTTTTTAATTGTAGAGQGTTVTQEFVEPLSVTTLSSTTSTVNDPGDTSAATTSTNTGPASQTATPASTATAAPAAPSLTPVAVSKDGADGGDFTLQTVKPPAPVTTAKQEARPTERTTTTPISPGIALQATQKTPTPSGSVLGRQISGSGNSSNW